MIWSAASTRCTIIRLRGWDRGLGTRVRQAVQWKRNRDTVGFQPSKSQRLILAGAVVVVLIILIGGVFWLQFDSLSGPIERTVIATISEKWIQENASRGGLRYTHVIRYQDGKDFTDCDVALETLWQSLEPNRKYELSITQSRSTCFVHDAKIADLF